MANLLKAIRLEAILDGLVYLESGVCQWVEVELAAVTSHDVDPADGHASRCRGGTVRGHDSRCRHHVVDDNSIS